MPSFGIEDVDKKATEAICFGLKKLVLNNPEQDTEHARLAAEYKSTL